MNRSLRELKIVFFITFPLLCAGRLFERVESLIVAPIETQQQIFGHVVAYPWAMRAAEITINREADIFGNWTFPVSDVPEPVKACQPSPLRTGGPYLRACDVGSDPDWYGAAWGRGQLLIQRSVVRSRDDLGRGLADD